MLISNPVVNNQFHLGMASKQSCCCQTDSTTQTANQTNAAVTINLNYSYTQVTVEREYSVQATQSLALTEDKMAYAIEQRVKEVLTEINVEQSAHISFQVSDKADIHIDSDHPQHKSITRRMQDDPLLRDLLVSARALLGLNRLEQASQSVYGEAALDTQSLQDAQNWLMQLLKDMREADFQIVYQSRQLQMQFLDDVDRIIEAAPSGCQQQCAA